MSEKSKAIIRSLISRRRTIQGGTALVTAAACGDDSTAGDGAGTGTGSTTTGDGSSSGAHDDNGSTSGGADGGSTTTASDSSGDGGSTSGGIDSTDGDSDGGSSSTGSGVELTPEELLANVDHIIVLCMENRSFDHYLGSLQLEGVTDVNGLDGTESNPDQNGVDVGVFEMDNFEPEDPPHSWEAAHAQWNNGANDGFVTEHFAAVGDALKHEVMGYHVRAQLPITYALADAYTVCDAWFGSVLGQTWPNRYYLHAVDGNGSQSNLPTIPGPTTIQSLCNDNGITNNNYYDGLAAWKWGSYPITGFAGTDSLDEFFDKLDTDDLEQVIIIDPDFLSNDDHPDHNIQLGQVLIGTVYQAIANSDYWDRTLLIITYDENGGFFDHVAPPTTVDDNGPEFAQMGFRVPSIVIGPHVRSGAINHTVFEHGSFAATAAVRFGLPPLNDRMAATADVSSCIDPGFIEDPQPPIQVPQLVLRESEIFNGLGDITSQPELFDAVGIKVPLEGDNRLKHRRSVERLLTEAERHGVAKVIRDLKE